MGGERSVELRGIERVQPVPEREVRRRGRLGLECNDAVDGLNDAESPAAEEELTGEGGPISARWVSGTPEGAALASASIRPSRAVRFFMRPS